MELEITALLVFICICVLAYLIIVSCLKKKFTNEIANKENTPPRVEQGVKVLEKEIGYKPSVGTVCKITFALSSGETITLSTGAEIYNNIRKDSTGTLKFTDEYIVGFTED